MEYRLTFEHYQKGLESGKFLGLKCGDCGTYAFPPQGICKNCAGENLKVAEIKGDGTLRSFTVIRVAPEGMKPPYIVALVELKEGAWTIGNLVDINPDEAEVDLIGRKVKLGSRSVKQGVDSEEDLRVLTFTLS